MKLLTQQSLERYRDYGVPVGDFLTAVLCNDLMGAFRFADHENTRDMKEIVGFVYEYMPTGAWRTKEKMKAWIEAGGLAGMKDNV